MVSRSAFALLVAPLLMCSATACWARTDTYAYAAKRDGTLAGYRVDDRTGKLETLPGVTSIGADRSPTLVLSADRRFLYAFWGFGWDPNDNEVTTIVGDEMPRPARKIGTRIAVLRIGPAGALTRVQTLSLPAPIAELEPRPGGQFVYGLKVARGAFLLTVGKGGRLSLRGSQDIISGVGGGSRAGERDEWELTFSPNGAYLYDYFGDGFIDHAENALQRYRVHPRTGKLTAEGNGWDSIKRKPATVAQDPGRVWAFKGRTAFVEGFADGLWICAVDNAGRILSRGSRLALKPRTEGHYGLGQHIVAHPSAPVVYYRGSAKDPYTVWRVTAPGKIREVGAFASAFTAQRVLTQQIEPGGRFFYEIAAKPGGDGGMPTPGVEVAVFALDKTGVPAKRTAPPYSLPDGNHAGFVFVAPPAK